MEKQLNQLGKIKQLRQFLLRQVDSLTTAQLNAIPPGYHNNIIWHLAHLNSAVQAICYVLAGQPIALDEQYFRPFLPGTRPERVLAETEITLIKELLITTIDQLRTDVERGIFTAYTPSERIAALYSIQVASLADALDFVLFHEGYHIGYVVALKHLV